MHTDLNYLSLMLLQIRNNKTKIYKIIIIQMLGNIVIKNKYITFKNILGINSKVTLISTSKKIYKNFTEINIIIIKYTKV